MCVVGRNILVVGIADKGNALKELPVQVIAMDTGAQAIGCLRKEKIDTIISHWELCDMAARRLGVDAVLSEDIDDELFRETVCQILGISTVASMQMADSYSGL